MNAHMIQASAMVLAVTFGIAAGAATAVKKPSESHGLDIAGMDTKIRPGSDFFAYANGGWLRATAIPPDRSSYNTFAILAEEANRRTVGLIQEAGKASSSDSDTKKVGDFYSAWMDEKAIEAKGSSPVAPELARIRKISNRHDLSSILGSQLRADVDPLNNTEFHTSRVFGLWVSPDFADTRRNAAYLMQGGLGMPDRDNYTGHGPKDAELQAKYRDHIAAVLKLADIGDGAARARRIYDLEAKIAAAHATRTESAEVHNAQDWRTADLPSKAPGVDWPMFLSAAHLAGQQHIYVWQPHGVTGIAALVGSEPLETWKDYLAFHVIDRGSPVLSRAFADEYFRFYGTALNGTPQQRERWKRAIEATNEALGDAVGKMYVARYFPPSSKAAAQEMVKNIVAAFGQRIDNLAWMAPATRAKAKAKLATLYIGVGYPDRWQDYSSLQVSRDDAFGNVQRAGLRRYEAAVASLAKPVDKTQWWMTPQTVNAVNLPVQNALNFPAAILNPPFFDAKADPVQNYGAIGTVIGHEISHSFDDQGALFDAEGRLANWWTKEDFAHFTEAANRLAAEFNQYEPLPGSHINGKLTLSENIADVAGIAAAYDGYRRAYNGHEAPAAQGLSGDQRFFVSFAQIWRSKIRPEALRSSLMTNGHAPGEFRADTVRNIDAWYAAFGVKPGERLYLTPQERVKMW